MTFHRQPSFAGPLAVGRPVSGEREGPRWITLLTPYKIPNTIDLCWPPRELWACSVSIRLNLTLSAIHLFPQGHNVSHKASHLQLPPCRKLPIQVKVHSKGRRAPDKLSKQPSEFKVVLSINVPAGGEIPANEKPLEPI